MLVAKAPAKELARASRAKARAKERSRLARAKAKGSRNKRRMFKRSSKRRMLKLNRRASSKDMAIHAVPGAFALRPAGEMVCSWWKAKWPPLMRRS